MGQSSNDVIPTAIHVSAYLLSAEELLPSLHYVKQTLDTKAAEVDDVVTTGRTHLMDAMPVRLSQVLGGWSSQIAHGIERVEAALPRMAKLAQGGTAVGTGINAHPDFGRMIAEELAGMTGQPLFAQVAREATQALMQALSSLAMVSDPPTGAAALLGEPTPVSPMTESVHQESVKAEPASAHDPLVRPYTDDSLTPPPVVPLESGLEVLWLAPERLAWTPQLHGGDEQTE
jgi:hypothetical protein